MGYTGYIGINSFINDFFYKKSIIHTYNFYVDLDLSIPIYGREGGSGKYAGTDIANNLWNYPAPYQILDVEIPTYKFQREANMFGTTQFSYPVLSKEQPIDLKITFEENAYGNIGRFVNILQYSVLERSGRTRESTGVHNIIPNMKIGNIYVYVADELKNSVYCWIFKDVFFLGYDNVPLQYDDNASLKYTVTFGCDSVQFVSDNRFYGVGTKYELDEKMEYAKAEFDTIYPTTSPVTPSLPNPLYNSVN